MSYSSNSDNKHEQCNVAKCSMQSMSYLKHLHWAPSKLPLVHTTRCENGLVVCTRPFSLQATLMCLLDGRGGSQLLTWLFTSWHLSSTLEWSVVAKFSFYHVPYSPIRPITGVRILVWRLISPWWVTTRRSVSVIYEYFIFVYYRKSVILELRSKKNFLKYFLKRLIFRFIVFKSQIGEFKKY